MQSGVFQQQSKIMLKAAVLFVVSIFGLSGLAAENLCVCSSVTHAAYCVYHLSPAAAPILTAQPGASCCASTQAHTCHVSDGHAPSAAELTLAIVTNAPRTAGQFLTPEAPTDINLLDSITVFLPPIISATARSAPIYLHHKTLLC
jgi:hypothetical protein